MADSDWPAVILNGGPLHRRVYLPGEVPKGIPYADAGRFATRTLGDIYGFLGKGVPKATADAVPRVFEFTGDDASLTDRGRNAAAGRGGGFARACTFLGCLEPARYEIGGNLDRRPWLGCEEHKAGMVAALAIGQAVGYSVDATPL